jgi:hypothetical protein
MTTLRARYDGKVLIPEGPVDLPTGSVLELHVLNASGLAVNAANLIANLRNAMNAPPRLNDADLDALDEAIEQGKLPVDQLGPFQNP